MLKATDCANKANGIGKMVCELCGEEMGYGTIKFEHAWVDTILEAATCTEDGLKNRECTVCGEIEEEVVIPATGEHDYVETFIDANCTEPAKYGTICVVCGLAKGDLKVVEGSEALGHEWEEDVIEAGCENAAGVLKTCLVCGEKELVEFTGENAVAALGHKEVAKDIAATCHATGTEGRTVCERCGEEIVAGTEVEINPDNHVLKEDGILVEATCSKAGTARYVCEHGCEYVTYKAYYADHAWSAEKVDNAGTCVYKECTVCGTIEIIETIVEADCENHTFVDVKGFAATDTKDGLTDGKKCSKCGLILYGCEKIPMITCVHEAGEVVIENEVQPTCAKEGSFDEVVYCVLCENEISRTTKKIDKVAHTEEVVPGKAATCTDDGLTDGIKCSVCGVTIKAQEKIPALGAENHVEEILPGREATCKEVGLTEGTKCSVCGAIVKAQEEIPALAHTEVVIEGKAATCTEAGYAESKVCSVCETVIAEATVIPALGHTEFVVPGKAATCAESGLSEGKICEVCFAVIVEQTEIPALGHTEEVIPGTGATCGESGLTDGIKCSVCGEVLKAQEEVTVAHSYSVSYDFNEDYTKKLKIYTCTKCGHTYSEEEDF